MKYKKNYFKEIEDEKNDNIYMQNMQMYPTTTDDDQGINLPRISSSTNNKSKLF